MKTLFMPFFRSKKADCGILHRTWRFLPNLPSKAFLNKNTGGFFGYAESCSVLLFAGQGNVLRSKAMIIRSHPISLLLGQDWYMWISNA